MRYLPMILGAGLLLGVGLLAGSGPAHAAMPTLAYDQGPTVDKTCWWHHSWSVREIYVTPRCSCHGPRAGRAGI